MRGNIVVRLLYRLILLFMIVGSVQGWGGGWPAVVSSGGGERARLGHVPYFRYFRENELQSQVLKCTKSLKCFYLGT